MLSSINFLFLSSLAITAWIILCYFKQIEDQRLQSNNVEYTMESTFEEDSSFNCRDNNDLYFNFMCIFICVYLLAKITQVSEEYIAWQVHGMLGRNGAARPVKNAATSDDGAYLPPPLRPTESTGVDKHYVREQALSLKVSYLEQKNSHLEHELQQMQRQTQQLLGKVRFEVIVATTGGAPLQQPPVPMLPLALSSLSFRKQQKPLPLLPPPILSMPAQQVKTHLAQPAPVAPLMPAPVSALVLPSLPALVLPSVPAPVPPLMLPSVRPPVLPLVSAPASPSVPAPPSLLPSMPSLMPTPVLPSMAAPASPSVPPSVTAPVPLPLASPVPASVLKCPARKLPSPTAYNMTTNRFHHLGSECHMHINRQVFVNEGNVPSPPNERQHFADLAMYFERGRKRAASGIITK